MTTLFISDLHLEPKHPEMAALFLDFLAKQASQAEALYILGDFFEVWVGDDDKSEFNKKIITALKKLTDSGVPVFIMHGNRDFLLGEKFLQETGCQFLADPTVIDLYGQRTLLMHGDTLCIDDKDYQKFRAKVRNANYQQFYLSLPLIIRKAIARLLRLLSQFKARKNNYNFIDANFNEIKSLMKKYNTQLLIHGHTHRPSIQYFKLNEKSNASCRIVLSDWETNGNVLVCEAKGEWRLGYFRSRN